MGKQIGIDLGTSNTLVYLKGRGLVLREPTVVSVEEMTGHVTAVGREAKRMLGKTPGGVSAVCPMKDGVIAEYDATVEILVCFFEKTCGRMLFSRPKVAATLPYGVTEVERRAMRDVMRDAGAQSVALIDKPMAAALGADLPVSAARGCMIVDIGGGTTEIAVISMDGIVLSSSIRVAGNSLDEAICEYVRKRHSVLIGEATAEQLKKAAGSLHPTTDRGVMEVRGRNLVSGLPATLAIGPAELREAMAEPLVKIIDKIRSTLESTPPELAADVYDSGIMLCGGTAMMPGIDLLIQSQTGIRTMIAKKPMDCVVMGIGKMLESGTCPGGPLLFRTR